MDVASDVAAAHLAADAGASDPDVEPPQIAAVARPENHPLAGVFEDWAWSAVWTAKWLREQRIRKKVEQRRNQRARRSCASKESQSGVSCGSWDEQERPTERRREGDDPWRSRVRREAKQRREQLREEARLRERWAKEEEIDDVALLAAGFAGRGPLAARPQRPQAFPPLQFCSLGLGVDVDASPVCSRSGSPASSEKGSDENSSANSSRSQSSGSSSSSTSQPSSPGIGPCRLSRSQILGLNPLVTWVTWAQLLSRRHAGANLGDTPGAESKANEPPSEPPPGRPPVVPALTLRKLSLLSTDDLIEPDETAAEMGEDVWDDMAKRWRISLEGVEVKAHQQIADLLHEFVGSEELNRQDAAASIQTRLLHELIQVHDENDLDMDVWNEAQRHAVAQILDGASQSNEFANVPVPSMRRLLAKRGYELPNPETCPNIGRGSFGRVLKVRRTSDGQLFAVKRQFLGDFADDMVPVLRETSILNLLKGACNVVQIEDAFLVRPVKGAAEVWSVLEHFPHNLHKVRHRFRSEESARRVVFQVLLGLHALHSADVVHRDVKPDNILVDLGSSPPYTVRVALCDFNTSRSVHGFAETKTSSPDLPQLPLVRKLTDRVTTSWWRAPEMWGWADTRQMTKRDLKSLDIFSLGLVWAELLAVKSVLEYWDGVDPPKFRLLEILQKVDRPTQADLNELGFSDDVSCFILCVLSGNLEALRPEMISPNWPQNQEKREALLEVPYIGIRAWVQQNAWQCSQDSPALDLIASMARFSYRERPTVESLVDHQFFTDLRAEKPIKVWSAPHCDDLRDVFRSEHERQGQAAKRVKELRELIDDNGAAGGEGTGTAQNAFFQRMAANTAADVEESVRSVCSRVRTVIKETQRRGRRRNRGRPSGCQGNQGSSISHSHPAR